MDRRRFAPTDSATAFVSWSRKRSGGPRREGLPVYSALRTAHLRRHLYVTSYTEGFSHLVTSMTAPVASGWSVCRVGFARTGKRRLITAHTRSRRP